MIPKSLLAIQHMQDSIAISRGQPCHIMRRPITWRIFVAEFDVQSILVGKLGNNAKA
jgi:hypothetical protein